jgi:hypothetical protein
MKEQFGAGWEHTATRDPHGFEVSGAEVAGNYGCHTNIWGIALVRRLIRLS